jgi:Nucleotidyl transferase AbiEii toxin, Type IV TA system
MKKPSRASGYDRGYIHHVRSTCLYVATKLGDLIDDVVVIGGLVPSLLIDQQGMLSSDDLHVGTLDLDVGLALAVFDEQRYAALTERLRQAGFSPDQNDQGQLTRQRWKIDGDVRVTVDFLIAPSLPGDKPGTLRNIEKDFAAIIAPGLHLAFADRERIRLKGHTLFGETATRDIWVAGPGAFVILKALAFRLRGENKDAYDLFYLLRHLGAGLADIVRRLGPHAHDPVAREALAMLREDFAEIDSVGPRRVAEFLLGTPDDVLQADARGLVLDFLALWGETFGS